MNLFKNLPGSIRALRKSRGMTQQELAALLGRETQAVSKWERGQTEITASLLGALVATLGYDLEHLDRVSRGLDPEDGLLPLPWSAEEKESPPRKDTSDAKVRERLAIETRELASRGVEMALHAKGWSVAEAARRCGWNESWLADALRTREGWTLETLSTFCFAAGIDLSEFFRLAESALRVRQGHEYLKVIDTA